MAKLLASSPMSSCLESNIYELSIMGWPTGCPSQCQSPRAAAGAERRMALRSAGAVTPQRVDNPAARLLPIATTLLATVISIQPAHIPGDAALTPAFTLMAVYHWTIYRPD